MKTKKLISKKNRDFVIDILCADCFLGYSKNAQRLENAKPQLSDIVKAYKIASKIYFDFSADMPKDEKEFWENACLNTRILLDRLFDEAILLYDARIVDLTNLGKFYYRFWRTTKTAEKIAGGNFLEITGGDKQQAKQFRAAAKRGIEVRDLARVFCDLHRDSIGKGTWFDAWLKIYNEASYLLKLPFFGETAEDLRRMNNSQLCYCSDWLNEQIKEAKNPEEKAKYDKLQISLHNEAYARGLLT